MLEIEDKVLFDLLVIFNSGSSKSDRYGPGTPFIHDADCFDIYLRFKRFFDILFN